jgi:tripartite-type tricarboxylate transporter receptor subunit TctC
VEDISMPRRRALLVTVSVLTARSAFAQSSRALRVVVPFPPGGAVDAAARLLSEKLPTRLNGRAVIVDNRPGAGGNIATGLVAQSAPDGDTLLVTSNNHTINISLYRKPGYTIDDFAPVAQFGEAGFAFVTHPSTGFKTLANLLDAARANPNEISFGSGGNGHPAHLATELLKSLANVSMQHVPYRGSGPLTSDLIGGQLPVAVISVSAAQPFVASGQLVALAVTSNQRWPGLLSVPTVEECGFPGYNYSAWIGVLIRKGAPAAEIATLEKEILTIAATEEARLRLFEQGMHVVRRDAAEFKEVIGRDVALNRDLIRKVGLQLD